MFYTLLLFCPCQQALCFLVPSYILTKGNGQVFPGPGPPYQKPYQSQQVGLPNRWVCPGLALPYGLAKAKGYAQIIYEIPLECLALNAMGLKKLERQFLEGCHP